ncbi:exopolysaccharide biosynthesis protein [Maricaulis sp.]|uniref:exopolysaccharide biosynthesis protein n=1 Tax=Maricaulis sp. TaxID=1486257 RepID=UPI00260D75D0|nr:exopolysaccharide biosynthesis protein [Maricaulis sp.]
MAGSEQQSGDGAGLHSEAEIGKGRPARLETLFDDLSGEEGDEALCVGDILNALAHRSYGPLLLLPALISVLPIIGAIPGVTWTMSALTLLISLQFLFNRQSLWLPSGVKQITVPRGLFERSLEWSRPWLKRLDSFIHPRLNLMMGPPWPFLVAILCVLLSLAMFVASVVPGGVVIPAFGVIFLAIGLTTHDGLILLTGIAASAAAFWGVAELVF